MQCLFHIQTGIITEIGRGNPLFPQAYFATSKLITLNPGDTVLLRCIYDTTGVTTPINTSEKLFQCQLFNWRHTILIFTYCLY